MSSQTKKNASEFASPKQAPTRRSASSGLFPYYAGFSAEFVKSALNLAPDEKHAVVLDPWNGSGTTTAVCEEHGIPAYGYDINPVMVLVAKSRLLSSNTRPSLAAIAHDINRKAKRLQFTLGDSEPLLSWFEPRAARALRRIERATHKLLIDPSSYAALWRGDDLASISSLASYFYVCLFHVVGDLVRERFGSNPTWVKAPTDSEVLLDAEPSQLFKAYSRAAEGLSVTLRRAPSSHCAVSVAVADSRRLPLLDGSVDMVITSPPYCTRIDYGVALWPELAVLGCPSRQELKALRDEMIGTPTMVEGTTEPDEGWGETCREFLESVATHSSKASRSYSLPYYLQYFGSAFVSLTEIQRVLRPGGTCVLVVRDSYYKDVRADLATIFTEMGAGLGWSTGKRTDFSIPNPVSQINTGSRKYRRSFQAVESAVAFRVRSDQIN